MSIPRSADDERVHVRRRVVHRRRDHGALAGVELEDLPEQRLRRLALLVRGRRAHDPLRPTGCAGGVDDADRSALGRLRPRLVAPPASRASSARRRAARRAARRRSPSASAGTTTTATPAGTLAAIAGHMSACTISTFAPLSPSTWAISSPRQCQLIGTALAPSGTVAIDASRNSSELRSSSATRSPAPMPRSCRPRVARSARPNSSSYVVKRSPQRTPICSWDDIAADRIARRRPRPRRALA